MDVIGVKAGMSIGEVGAGNGYFTFKLAQRVGPTGAVYANDIDRSALRSVEAGARRRNLENIITVRGEVADPRFPPGVMDLVIMVYVFHELAEPVKLLQNLKPSLKPGAPLVILERDPEKVGGSSGHFYHADRILGLVAEAGFELRRVETFLPRDNIYILRGDAPARPPANAEAPDPDEEALPTVSHYDLTFRLRLKENRLEAESLVEVHNNSRRPVAELPFILYRLFDVLDVTDEKGAALPFSQDVVKFSDETSLQINLVSVRLDPPLSPEKARSVRLRYAGALWGYPEVMAYVRDRIDENYSLLRPDSLAYPVLARASFQSLVAAHRSRFTYRVEAEVPAGYVVASGGRPVETKVKGSALISVFESHRPTWRIDVAASKFRTAEDSRRGIRVFALPEDEGEAARILETALKSFAFFSGILGEPGDFPGYTIIEIPEGWGSQAGDFYGVESTRLLRGKLDVGPIAARYR
jgi:SAM-dependent methyltransferase